MVKIVILNLVLCSLISLSLINYAQTSPIFDKLFGLSAYHEPSSGYTAGYQNNGYNGYNYNSQYRTQSTRRQSRGKGRSYNDICRVVQSDNYAVPGRVSAPFCPYG